MGERPTMRQHINAPRVAVVLFSLWAVAAVYFGSQDNARLAQCKESSADSASCALRIYGR